MRQRVIDFVKLHAASHPDKPALLWNTGAMTYRELYQNVLQRQSQWMVERGKAVLIPNSQDAEFVINYLASQLAGVVSVPVEADMPSDKAESLQNLLEGVTWDAEMADILYTTGTTGQSKAVKVSHRAIAANTDNLLQGQGYQSDLLFVISGPLNHIGCLSKLQATLRVGATAFLLPDMKDLGAFFAALNTPSFSHVATFLVPAAISMVMALAADRLAACADRLDFLETGAAPMPHADMLRLCRLLPHTRLYNTYASTEAGIIATYNFNDGTCLAGCVGNALPHSTFQLDAQGRIICGGETLMSGYAGDEESTQRLLVDGQLHTSDRGQVDSQGRLYLLGRDDDVINTGGFKVNPIEVEDVARSYPGLFDCIVVATSHPLIGTVLKLLYVPCKDTVIERRALAQYLSARLEHYKVPFYFEEVSGIRRTFNGKPDRKYYRNASSNG